MIDPRGEHTDQTWILQPRGEAMIDWKRCDAWPVMGRRRTAVVIVTVMTMLALAAAWLAP